MLRWIANCLPFVFRWRFEGMPFEVHFGCWGWLWISFGRPWGYPGHGLGPGLARGRQNGLDCTPARAVYQDPGIQVMAQVGGGFACSGPYYQSNNCLIQGTFTSELLDSRLRKAIVQLLVWTAPPQPGGTLFEGPADICIQIHVHIHIHMHI